MLVVVNHSSSFMGLAAGYSATFKATTAYTMLNLTMTMHREGS